MKYKPLRVPIEAYDNLVNKKLKIEQTLFNLTKKNIKIPLTKILIAVAENPITLYDKYLLDLASGKKIKNKKGQFEYSLAILIMVIIGIIIIAPVLLKVVNSVLIPMTGTLGNMTAESGTAMTNIRTTFVNFFDFALVIAFFANILFLFISASLVVAYPVFFLIYVVLGIFMFIMLPIVKGAIDTMYSSAIYFSGGTDIATQLPYISFLKDYLILIALGTFILTGIIIYARFKTTGGKYD